jgi:hypothetical protein
LILAIILTSSSSSPLTPAINWEVERGLAERGRGDYYERIEGYCLTDGQGNIYVASIKWVFQVMGGGGGSSGSRASSSGGPKAGSVEEVVARITGAALPNSQPQLLKPPFQTSPRYSINRSQPIILIASHLVTRLSPPSSP